MKKILLLPLLIALAGCTTLSDMKILNARFGLLPPGNALIPGSEYRIKAEFEVNDFSKRPETNLSGVMKQQETKWITGVGWNDLDIRFIGQETYFPRPFVLRVPAFTFQFLQNPHYTVVFAIKNNDYPAQTFEYAVEWSTGTAFDFSGAGGRDEGDHGSHAPNVSVEAAYYDVSGTALEGLGNFVIIHCPEMNRTALVRLALARDADISARGGDGARGENGSDSYPATEDNPEVYGRDGQDGGDGGDGGTINYYYAAGDIELSRFFKLDVRGGKGGKGGRGGRGDSYTDHPDLLDLAGEIVGTNYGNDGRDGRNGRNGFTYRNEKPLEKMFLTITDPDFDRSRLSATPVE
jgi:hypothetical protein